MSLLAQVLQQQFVSRHVANVVVVVVEIIIVVVVIKIIIVVVVIEIIVVVVVVVVVVVIDVVAGGLRLLAGVVGVEFGFDGLVVDLYVVGEERCKIDGVVDSAVKKVVVCVIVERIVVNVVVDGVVEEIVEVVEKVIEVVVNRVTYLAGLVELLERAGVDDVVLDCVLVTVLDAAAGTAVHVVAGDGC